MLDARLRLLEQPDRPLRHNTEISLHTGSAEIMARVRLLEKEEALPGDTTWVQFILAEPLAAANGDHYVIRSPMDTLGGGIIVEAHPRVRHRRFSTETLENLKARGEGKTEELLLAALKARQPQALASFLSQTNLAPDLAQSAIESLMEQGKIVALGEGKNRLLYTDSGWKPIRENIIAMVQDYHRRFPIRLGMPKAEIGSKLRPGTHSLEALQKLLTEGALVEESVFIRLPTHEIKLDPTRQEKIYAYLSQLSKNPYSPTSDITLEPDLLNLLVDRGQVVKTTAGVVFSAAAYNEMASKILDRIKANGKITLGEVRDMFSSSRKYIQALLEYMDEKKLTKRVGDDRLLGEKGLP